MRAPDPQPSPAPIPIGAEGFAMLALSAGLMLLSCGATWLLCLAYVLWVACRTGCDAPAARRILVLGLRLAPDGAPGPDYRLRLTRAAVLHARGGAGQIVLLGGTTAAGQPSEAAAGAAFLRAAHQVPGDAILLEDCSRHTLENLLLYRERFAAEAAPAVLVTSRFHLARSCLLAAGLAIRHVPCAAEPSRWPPLRHWPAMMFEAVLIHWYLTGRGFARLTGNRRMAARIS